MKTCTKRFSRTFGFTMVEVLAAVAVIAILISLIIPALSMVQRSADLARQRAQFHSIEIALEAFRADFGDYPESNIYKPYDLNAQAYCGAQKLAEALIGLDGFGFHPDSFFAKNGQSESEESLYLNSEPPVDQAESGDNLKARKGPYLELETANAVKLGDLYKAESFLYLHPWRFVLADMFGSAKHRVTGKRTGMPILYYRANTSHFNHDPENYEGNPDNIYDYLDNHQLVEMQHLWNKSVSHPMADDPGLFYENTLNPNFPPKENPYFPGKPYRAESFILLSAGPDGLYGTPDDVFNFNKGE